MHPVLIDLGRYDLPLFGETHVFLPTYGFLFAAAVLIAWSWFFRRARRLDVPEDKLFNVTFYALLAGIFGAKLLLIVVDWRTYLAHPSEILGTLRSAGVLLGGVVAGALTFILYARHQRMPLWKLADAIAAPLVLAQAVGRLGCFAAGCCWGRPTDAGNPLAVVFVDPATRTGVPLGQPLIATQLIEMGYDLLLALLLTVAWRRRLRPDGAVFWLYLLLYGIGRGLIEFWRGDAGRGLYLDGAISTSQAVSLAAVALGATMLARGRLATRRAREA